MTSGLQVKGGSRVPPWGACLAQTPCSPMVMSVQVPQAPHSSFAASQHTTSPVLSSIWRFILEAGSRVTCVKFFVLFPQCHTLSRLQAFMRMSSFPETLDLRPFPNQKSYIHPLGLSYIFLLKKSPRSKKARSDALLCS